MDVADDLEAVDLVDQLNKVNTIKRVHERHIDFDIGFAMVGTLLNESRIDFRRAGAGGFPAMN